MAGDEATGLRARDQAAQHLLSFLPLPQAQESLRPGTASARAGESVLAARRRSQASPAQSWHLSFLFFHPAATDGWQTVEEAHVGAWLGSSARREQPGRAVVPGMWPDADTDVHAGGAEGGAIAVNWWATPYTAFSLAAYDDHYLASPLEEPNQSNFWLVMARTTISFR